MMHGTVTSVNEHVLRHVSRHVFRVDVWGKLDTFFRVGTVKHVFQSLFERN